MTDRIQFQSLEARNPVAERRAEREQEQPHEDTPSLDDHPFFALVQSESYESPSEKAWLRWVKKVEKIIGHDLDGNQDQDGYSLDFAYSAWESGLTPEQHAAEIAAETAKRE